MRSLTVLCAFLLMSSQGIAASSYLCIADKAAGFRFNSTIHEWTYAQFRVEGDKYLLSETEGAWRWKKFGEKNPFAGENCKKPNDAGFIFCDGLEDIRMNTKNLRFQVIYAIGYIGNEANEGSDTPSIEIGICAAL